MMSGRCPCPQCAYGLPNQCTGPRSEEVQASWRSWRRDVAERFSGKSTNAFANGSPGFTFATEKLRVAIERAASSNAVEVWSALQNWVREMRADWKREEFESAQKLQLDVMFAVDLEEAQRAIAAFVEVRKQTQQEPQKPNSHAKP